MKRDDIKCLSCKEPDQWVYLEDTDHAYKYAHEIFRNIHSVFELFVQHHDFKWIFNDIKSRDKPSFDKRTYLAFQIQFQGECLAKIITLRKERSLSCTLFPFA